MNNKLTQDQIAARIRMYNKAIELMTDYAKLDNEQAKAVVKVLVWSRNDFIKRMEAGKVGRKAG